ncbi:carbohydrate binding domain-containing protein [Lacunisphaera limnophila]|uniref:carbohydrate binding domain-containing protein n=1 Tax=Lacunisphaera limnophila TaxID=1838286 RepID=UPI0008599D46|nr:carbohydrate binding domain-containing protein [Lacunisphaera limnophila]
MITLLMATALLGGFFCPARAADPVTAVAEMLHNGDFSAGLTHWESEQANGATARIDVVPDGPAGHPALRFEVLSVSDQSWRLQWSQKRISITQGRPYVLTFWARAKNAGAINVTCMQNHAPWDHATQAKFELTPEWRQFEFPFTGAWDDTDARISFTNLGTAIGQEYWFARCSLQPR